MAKASEQTAENNAVRALYIGDSGSGKTGSLISLLQAGYTIRMLDLDNNSDSLVQLCRHHDPKLLERLDIIRVRDKFRASQFAGLEVAGQPKAWVDALKYLNKWDDGTSINDWDDKTIFVLDTLTSAGRAAFHWAKGMNPNSKDPRQWYAAGQDSLKTMLELLTSPDFSCHILVISHIDLVERDDGTTKGYASSLGKALGPQIAKVFPTLIMAETKGSGNNIKRTITTRPTMLVDLKNPVPFKMEERYPLETGMATIFATLLGGAGLATPASNKVA
jgi:hypothetical protein